MAKRASSLIAWERCRGRNGWDAPQDIPKDMAEEALNVDFYDGGLGRKRGGSADSGITAHAGLGSTLYLDIFSWVPGQDPAARELFTFHEDSGGKIGRVAAGSVATNITFPDPFQLTGLTRTSCASLNGKLFMSMGQARPWVYDPGYSTTAVRVVGLGKPGAAPTVANTGSGSYAAVARYYKVAFTEQQSSVTVRRGELSAASAVFTPSGSGTHARITRPTAISDGETHWEIYASADGASYYGPILTTAVATTTADDNLTVTTYATDYDLAPVEGANKPMVGGRFLYSNGSRLFVFGARSVVSDSDTITPQSGTVYFSPALDSSGIHDEERCQDTVDAVGKVILGRNAGGVDRGISGLGNIIVAFQSQGVYGLVPTEDPDTPFRRVQYSASVGAVSNQSIVQAEDERGRPCLYFLDPIKGPYRLGADGLRWVGKDVFDIWSTVALDTTTTWYYPHGLYYQAKRQVWFWVNADGSAAPSAMLVLNIDEQREDEYGDLRGGWSKWTGTLATQKGSTMMSSTLGATMSLALKPYACSNLVTGTIYKADNATGDNVQAYVQSGGLNMAPIRNGITRSTLLAQASSGVTITQTFVRNFGDETNRTDTVSLTATGSESHVLRAFDASALQDAYVFQVRLGDGSAAQNQWTLDRWYADLHQNEDV